MIYVFLIATSEESDEESMVSEDEFSPDEATESVEADFFNETLGLKTLLEDDSSNKQKSQVFITFKLKPCS